MHIADVISLSEIWDWFKVYFWSNMTPPARSTGNQNKRRSPNITPGRSPYYPLSPDDEIYTIFISIALYYVAVFIMVPAMKAYYWREKNVTITTDDLQEIILIFKNENKNNPGFLRYLFSNEDMFWLNATRNQINHEDLSQIFANWKDDFWVLRHLCQCMGDRQAELEVIRIFNLVNSGNAREAVRLRFNFSQSDPYYVVLCLTHILYVVLVKYLAKNLWHFLLSKRHPSSSFNPSLDLYVNLKNTIAKQQSNTNYIGFRGVVERDEWTLWNCFFARNANRHGQYLDIQNNWDSFLTSIIKLLERLNQPDDAREVRIILSRLQAARTNGTDVRYEDLFRF